MPQSITDFENNFPVPVEAGPGWFPLINAIHQTLLKLDPDYKIEQIKEKLGGLRYYFQSDANDRIFEIMHNIVKSGEDLSFHICENCGDIGSLRGEGWLRTLCDKCDQRNLHE